MARNFSTAVYSGSLKLDKVTGIRHDLGQRATPIQSVVKPNTSLPQPKRSMKTTANITNDGLNK
jgi:hypothetical protein